MKKVKVLRSFIGPGGAPVKPGSTVELDNGLAQNLIIRGRAELVEETQKKPAAPPAAPKPPVEPKK